MKKLVAVLLVVCMLLPSAALANDWYEQAKTVKGVITASKGQTVSEYYYTMSFCLLLSSLSSYYHEYDQSQMTVFNGLLEAGDSDLLASMTSILGILDGARQKEFVGMAQDALDCYTSGEYSLDGLEKYADFLISIGEQYEQRDK